MTDSEIVLSIRHLHLNLLRQNQEIPILRDVNLDIRKGEKWAIAGESGAGKSMTMYALTSLLPEKSTVLRGEIRYREEDGTYTDILKLPFAKRSSYCAKKASLIFQDSMDALNPFEKIGAQWCHTLRYSHPEMKKQERIEHILARLADFGITDRQVIRKYPYQLSGGMKQRIAMAMALESGAEILIADEPTTALDAVNQRRVVSFIQQLCKKKNLTLLYISHDLVLLQELCTHMAVLKEGRIVETGLASEVFDKPQHAYTRELIEETRKLFLE